MFGYDGHLMESHIFSFFPIYSFDIRLINIKCLIFKIDFHSQDMSLSILLDTPDNYEHKINDRYPRVEVKQPTD